MHKNFADTSNMSNMLGPVTLSPWTQCAKLTVKAPRSASAKLFEHARARYFPTVLEQNQERTEEEARHRGWENM
jgi:hypothetical protein